MNRLTNKGIVATFFVVVACVAPSLSAASKSISLSEQQQLRARVQMAMDVSRKRHLNAQVHTPWQIMHGILTFGEEFTLNHGNSRISAVEWIATNPRFRGDAWFEKTEFGGRAHPFTEPYFFEGHPNQFLAIMSLAGLKLDFEIQTKDGKITIADMVEHARMTVNDREEITWTLWALSHYIHCDSRWKNKESENWSIEKLVQIQTRDTVVDAACGGTHGLFALAYARNRYLETGRPLRGVWIEAEQKLQKYIAMAKALQNSDGTFSSAYFKGPENKRDFADVCASSGHILEFLMQALPDDRLHEPWVAQGVAKLANGLIENRHEPIEVGALYHALSGLRLYLERTNSEAIARRAPKKIIAPEIPETVASQPPDTAATQRKLPTLTGNNGSQMPSIDLPLPSLDGNVATIPTPSQPTVNEKAVPTPGVRLPSLGGGPEVAVEPKKSGEPQVLANNAATRPITEPQQARDIARQHKIAMERRRLELKLQVAEAQAERATANALRAEAMAQRAEAEALEAEAQALQAEADAKYAEAKARRVEASAKRTNANALRADAVAEEAEASAVRREAEARKAEFDVRTSGGSAMQDKNVQSTSAQ